MIETIPLPLTDDPVDAPFWQGCREGRLLVQYCADCAAPRHPPRVMCPECRSMRTEWRAVVGRGTVWSFATPRPPLLPAFAALGEYAVALIELEDAPEIRIVGAVVAPEQAMRLGGGVPPGIAVGALASVRFVPVAEDVVLPCWALDGTATRENRK